MKGCRKEDSPTKAITSHISQCWNASGTYRRPSCSSVGTIGRIDVPNEGMSDYLGRMVLARKLANLD